MDLLFKIINLILLVAIIYFFGKKAISGILKSHREKIDESLKKAELGLKLSEEYKNSRDKAGDNSEKIAVIKSDANMKRYYYCLEIEKNRNIELEMRASELRQEFHGLRLDMLACVKSHSLEKVSKQAAELMASEPYASKFRTRESAIVDKILSLIKVNSGDMSYLIYDKNLYVALISAFPLEQEIVEKVKSAVIEMLGKVGGVPDFAVRNEPAVIGGLCLRIGDTVYDGTVANILYTLNSRMARKPVYENMSSGEILEDILSGIKNLSEKIDIYQRGRVISVSDGICWLNGLSDIMYGEVVEFDCGERGMVMDIETDRIGCVIFGSYERIHQHDGVRRAGRMASVPVGEVLLGRVVDPLGRAIDGKGSIQTKEYRPIEKSAPAILDRKSVSVPLQTGIKAIDALVPIGRGQRELIIGDRQTGKTSIAIDTIINQKGKGVYCIYVAIGQKESTVAGLLYILKKYGAMEYTTIVCADAFQSSPMQYIAPYAGTAMGEYFMYQGKDVLIIYDDLSKHAVAYRELSLLLHRPSGREAYPGDVFYLHSRLLERSARLDPEAGGGSMTALPIIETQAGDISAYIPTNAISITDGQIFLESDLFHEGQRPAVNVGLSVSRVGGTAQIKAMRQVAGRLRMDLAQYRELETFSQFGSDLDIKTKAFLERGVRMNAILNQSQYSPLPVEKQVLIIFAVAEGLTDSVSLDNMDGLEKALFMHFEMMLPDLLQEIASGEKMSDDLISRLRENIKSFMEGY